MSWFSLFLKPQKCPLCKKFSKQGKICFSCKNQILFVYEPICIVCEKESLEGKTHLKCYKKTAPDMLITPFYYENTVRKIILNAKYYGKFKQITEIIKYTLVYKEQFNLHFFGKEFVLTNVPSDKDRFKKRGFNLPTIISRELSKNLNIEFKENLLYKKYSTPSLTQKRKIERQRAVKNIFEIKNKNKIPKKILLIDDIITTGSTLLECTKVLKKNGARQVICFALAYKKLIKPCI